MLLEHSCQIFTFGFDTLEEMIQKCKRVDGCKMLAERTTMFRNVISKCLVEPSCFPRPQYKEFHNRDRRIHFENTISMKSRNVNVVEQKLISYDSDDGDEYESNGHSVKLNPLC